VPDDVGTGVDVQLVRQAIEDIVLPGVLEIEDVVGEDADLADARACGFELREARQAFRRRRLLRGGRRGDAGERGQASEKRMPQQVLN
jgi:hypothetical protein